MVTKERHKSPKENKHLLLETAAILTSLCVLLSALTSSYMPGSYLINFFENFLSLFFLFSIICLVWIWVINPTKVKDELKRLLRKLFSYLAYQLSTHHLIEGYNHET